MDVVFTTGNSLLQISVPEFGPGLPVDLTKAFESRLCYTHSTFNQPTYFSKKSGVSTEIRRVFQYDLKGNLVCPKGFISKLETDAKSLGYSVKRVDIDAEYQRGPAFQYDLDRLSGRIQLKDKQDECLAELLTSEGGIIVGPTGFGKSFMFSAICLVYPNAKIQIVTKRVDVMKRIYGGLSKFIPKLGMVGSGNCNWERVTVITADSMHRISHTDEGLADILLYDEVHEAVAPTYQHELGKFLRTRKFGFTASPDGRMDGAHFMLEAIFGPRIFELSYSDAVDVNLVVPIKVEWVAVDGDGTSPCADLAGVTRERWGIWRNEVRNKIIADKAREYTKDDQVLIMVKSIEHAVHLKQFLPEFKLCYDSMDPADYSRYVSKGMLDHTEPLMIPAKREEMRLGFERGTLKKVISTDVWSTGVDFAQLAVLIRADARASRIVDIQAPGRVARKHEASGKEFGVVIDFMDNFDFTFQNRSRSRRVSYRKMGWEEITMSNGRLLPDDAVEVLEEAFDE